MKASCVFGCRRHYSSDSFCWLCDATFVGLLRYTDFRSEAEHRRTLLTHDRYVAHCLAERMQPSSIFSCPGTTLMSIAIDTMHAGDLGSFQDAIGSLFWLEITNKALYRTNAIGLRALNHELALYYRANPEFDPTKLTLPQLRSRQPGYPCLKAKAGVTRHLVGFALTLAARHAHGDGERPPFSFRATYRLAPHAAEYRRLVLECFSGLNEYLQNTKEDEYDIQSCQRGMYQYLQSLQALNVLWRRDAPAEDHGAMPWHIRKKKNHLLQHLVEDHLERWGSPRRFWCYGDESYVGAIKTLASRSKHPHTLERVVMEKLKVFCGVHAWLERNRE